MPGREMKPLPSNIINDDLANSRKNYDAIEKRRDNKNLYLCGFNDDEQSPCGKAFKTNVDLERHEWGHLPSSYAPFECHLCSERFVQSTHRNQHIRSTHDKIKDFNRCTCGMEAADASQISRHLRNNLGHDWAKYRGVEGNRPKPQQRSSQHRVTKTTSPSSKRKPRKAIVPKVAKQQPPGPSDVFSEQHLLPNADMEFQPYQNGATVDPASLQYTLQEDDILYPTCEETTMFSAFLEQNMLSANSMPYQPQQDMTNFRDISMVAPFDATPGSMTFDDFSPVRDSIATPNTLGHLAAQFPEQHAEPGLDLWEFNGNDANALEMSYEGIGGWVDDLKIPENVAFATTAPLAPVIDPALQEFNHILIPYRPDLSEAQAQQALKEIPFGVIRSEDGKFWDQNEYEYWYDENIGWWSCELELKLCGEQQAIENTQIGPVA